MANHEACELYIEQQINEGLEDGKTPYTIGKELSTWIARLFEVKIPKKTLVTRAYRKKEEMTSNEVNEENSTNSDINSKLEKLEKTHGGARPGAGRKPKQPDPPSTWTCTVCGGTFPMNVRSCNCPTVPGVDVNGARIGVLCEKLYDQKEDIKKAKAAFEKEYYSADGAYLWTGKIKSFMDSIHTLITEAEKHSIPIFDEARSDKDFIIKWNYLSTLINERMRGE